MHPRKTAASESQPRPLEIFGTNEERRKLKMQPLQEAQKLAMHHALTLHHGTFIPCDFKTLESLPVIRKYSPLLVKNKNVMHSVRSVNVASVVMIRICCGKNKNLSEERTPRVLKTKTEMQEINAFIKRFNPSDARKGFALNFSIMIATKKMNIVQLKSESVIPKNTEPVFSTKR